jgi:CHAD domain-containing protein
MARAKTANDPVAAATKLLKLSQKRFERFVTLVPKFLINDDPAIIHDLRVGSRRLQQTLRALVEATPASRKAVRVLRNTRRALGACRNLDVNNELIQQRARRAQSAESRIAWEELGGQAGKRRARLVAAARKKIAKLDLVDFIERVRKIIAPAEIDGDPAAKLEAALADSMTAWDEALRRSLKDRSVKNLHRLRIATKRLRYRAEILVEIRSVELRSKVADLKKIQTALGDWHDRSVLLQDASDWLTQSDFLADHPERAGSLLAAIDLERRREPEAVRSLLGLARQLRRRWDRRRAHDSTGRAKRRP